MRIATAADIENFYGGPPLYSMRAVVAELDGKIIAIGGTYRIGLDIFAFSDMHDEMRGRKRDMVRMVKLGLPLLAKYTRVAAFASPKEPTSRNFLQALGFEPFGQNEKGEVFIWQR